MESDDQARAERQRQAQQRLLALGADALPARPWRPEPMPPTATELTQFAIWKSGALSTEDLLAAIALLPAARAELDGVEAGLLFAARAVGLTWAQIADAMGFRSPQACQQHFTRLARREERA